MDIRIGNGFDVHRFAEGRKLVLGGAELPHDRGLLGHSDADALLHAIADAVLGALALGDIGKHFPDDDPAFKDADSRVLLARVAELARERGWEVSNVDAVAALERPKLKPHIDEMRARIAEALGVEVGRVSVKATTTEKLGFVGREEGVAAWATALLRTARDV
jgi:2-C-methyl-D-erythritol 2,4-cyclodiphosphate synthase